MRWMDLGLTNRSWRDLNAYERTLLHSRLLGYGAYPDDEVARNGYLATYSAARIVALKTSPNRIGRSRRDRDRLLQEETTYFEACGGQAALIAALGKGFYDEQTEALSYNAGTLSVMLMCLYQLSATPAVRSNLSIEKAAHVALDFFQEGRRMFRLKSKTLAPSELESLRNDALLHAAQPGNIRDLKHCWRFYSPVVHFLTAFAFTSRTIRRRSPAWDPIVSSTKLFLEYSEGTSLFLTTNCPHPGKKPFVSEDHIWRFPDALIEGVKPRSTADFGKLDPLTTEVAGRYRAYKKTI